MNRADDAGGGMLRGGQAFMGGAALTLAGSGLGAMLSLVNEAIVARVTGPEIYGLYAIGMMLAKIGEILAGFGVPFAILHYLPVHISRSERHLALGTILGGAGLPLFLGGMFAGALWFGADWIARDVFGDPRAALYIGVIGLAIPAMALAELLGNIARGFGRPVLYVLIRNLVTPVCYLAVLIAIARAGAAANGAVAVAYWAATACGAVAGIVVVGNLVRRRIGLVRPELRLRRLYVYAAPIMANSVFSLAIVWTDLLLLGVFTESATVGVYRACMQIAIAFDLIWNACSAATAPLYPVLVAGRDWGRLRQVYGTAVRLAVLLSLPLTLGILANAGDILGLLHPEFRVAAPALAILAIGQAVKTSFGAASILLVMGGGQAREARNGGYAAGLNLLLNLALIPRFGLIGAALATASSLTAISVLRCWQVRRLFAIKSLDPSIPRAVLATVLVALAIGLGFAALGLGPGSGLGAFAFRVAVEGIALASTLWLVCLGAEDRVALIALLTRRNQALAPP